MNFIHFSYVFLICTLLVGRSVEAENKKIVISIFGKSDSPVNMLTKSVMTEAYRRLGIKIDLKFLPGIRALKHANHGVTDGDLCRVKGIEKEYTNLVMVPVKVASVEIVAFGKNKNITVNGWDSLHPYSIAYLRGIKIISKKAKGKLKPVSSKKQAFKLLAFNRVDLVIDTRIMGLVTLEKLKIENVRIIEPPLQEIILYHYLNKKHTGLVPELTKILNHMTKTNQISKISKEVFKEIIER